MNVLLGLSTDFHPTFHSVQGPVPSRNAVSVVGRFYSLLGCRLNRIKLPNTQTDGNFCSHSDPMEPVSMVLATKRQPDSENDLQGEYIPKQMREKFEPNP